MKLPAQILALFTQAKSFEGNPVIGNRWLNRMGLHVLRVVLAHAAMQIRRWMLAGRLPAEYRRQFARDGFVRINNILPPEAFAALSARAQGLMVHPEGVTTQQGDSRTWQLFLGNHLLSSAPELRHAIEHPLHQAALSYVAGRLRTPFHWLQVVHNGAIADAPHPDPQRSLHSDTFQPGMKAWLFLSEADSGNGAFTYVPGSHRLTRKRLAWEYRQSLIGRDLPTPYARRGSFRIDAAALPSLELPSPHALECQANTLIVADTFGFHCRGPASTPDARRIEIWSLARPNPFNPLPGLPFAFLSRVERHFYPRFEALRLRLRQAAERRQQIR